MKKLFIFALFLLMAFGMTGCTSEEVAEILDARDTAEAQYSSYDYENIINCYAKSEMMYDEYNGEIMTFSQNEYSSLRKLRNGDQKGHTSVVNNKGTSTESSFECDYYQKGAYAYYDVGEYGKYKQKSLQAEVNDTLGDYINGLQAKDFKSFKVTELKNGGKRLQFILDPSSVPDEIANEYLLGTIYYLPPEFNAESAKLVSFEYTIELDKNSLQKSEQWKVKMKLELKSGYTANVTEEHIMNYTKYYDIPDDHIVFPKDLQEYPDYDTYVANLPNRRKS